MLIALRMVITKDMILTCLGVALAELVIVVSDPNTRSGMFNKNCLPNNNLTINYKVTNA